MTTEPLLLDLFCGAGGAAEGYRLAGFRRIVGVDIEPQPNYPFEFVQADAIESLVDLLRGLWVGPYRRRDVAAIHASPVCHDWSPLASVSGKDGSSQLLLRTLELLPEMRLPWIVENTMGAPLARTSTLFGTHGAMLCGTMFDLKVLRHRLFEASFPIAEPRPCGSHEGEFYTPAGHGDPNWRKRQENPHARGVGYADRCREAMGIPWMNRDELAQAIPPAYTNWLGRQLLAHIRGEVAA